MRKPVDPVLWMGLAAGVFVLLMMVGWIVALGLAS